jgi:hypothetical protein
MSSKVLESALSFIDRLEKADIEKITQFERYAKKFLTNMLDAEEHGIVMDKIQKLKNKS